MKLRTPVSTGTNLGLGKKEGPRLSPTWRRILCQLLQGGKARGKWGCSASELGERTAHSLGEKAAQLTGYEMSLREGKKLMHCLAYMEEISVHPFRPEIPKDHLACAPNTPAGSVVERQGLKAGESAHCLSLMEGELAQPQVSRAPPFPLNIPFPGFNFVRH